MRSERKSKASCITSAGVRKTQAIIWAMRAVRFVPTSLARKKLGSSSGIEGSSAESVSSNGGAIGGSDSVSVGSCEATAGTARRDCAPGGGDNAARRCMAGDAAPGGEAAAGGAAPAARGAETASLPWGAVAGADDSVFARAAGCVVVGDGAGRGVRRRSSRSASAAPELAARGVGFSALPGVGST